MGISLGTVGFVGKGVACQLASSQYSSVPSGFSSHLRGPSSSSGRLSSGTWRHKSRISATRRSSSCPGCGGSQEAETSKSHLTGNLPLPIHTQWNELPHFSKRPPPAVLIRSQH